MSLRFLDLSGNALLGYYGINLLSKECPYSTPMGDCCCWSEDRRLYCLDPADWGSMLIFILNPHIPTKYETLVGRCSFSVTKLSLLDVIELLIFSLTMSQEGSISLRAQPPPPVDFGTEELRITDQEPPDLDQTASIRHGSNKKRACVLIGNGLLQLPIWGM